jgi:serine/threonine protein kinase
MRKFFGSRVSQKDIDAELNELTYQHQSAKMRPVIQVTETEHKKRPLSDSALVVQRISISPPTPTLLLSSSEPRKHRRSLMTERFKKLQRIGGGGQGSIFLVEDVETGEKKVMKRIICNTNEDANDAISEAFLGRLLHPNIAEFENIFLDTEPINDDCSMFSVCMVMPYYEEKDLFSYIKKRINHKPTKGSTGVLYVPPYKVISFLKQLATAMTYVHSKRTLHRDIKPSNVLLADNYTTVKLCDFGFARTVTHNEEAETILGTETYMAPELFKKEQYSFPADVWSLGILMYVLMTFKIERVLHGPKLDLNEETYSATLRSDMLRVYSQQEALVDLIMSMLKVDPTKRLTASQILDQVTIIEEQLPKTDQVL